MGRIENFSPRPEAGLQTSNENEVKAPELHAHVTTNDALREQRQLSKNSKSDDPSLAELTITDNKGKPQPLLVDLTIFDDLAINKQKGPRQHFSPGEAQGVPAPPKDLKGDSNEVPPAPPRDLKGDSNEVPPSPPRDLKGDSNEVPPPPPRDLKGDSNQGLVPLSPLDRTSRTVDTPAPPRDRASVQPDSLGPNVTFDANHQISKISYPNENKTREFGRDQNGEINKLVTTTPEGQFTYVKEGDKWSYLAPDKHKYPADKFMLDANGEFSRVVKDGVAQTQRADGTSFQESVTALGARVKKNEQGQPELIKRPDGSVIGASYENGQLSQLVETENGKSITWKPTGKDGNWTSDEQPPNTVQKLSLESNGNITYSTDNVKYIVRSNGTELEEGPGRSTFKFDDQGRFKSITTPDGNKTRSFEYEGGSSEPSRIQITDREKNDTKSFVHQPEQGGWTQVDQYNRSLGTWKGEIKLHDDGTYAIKAEGTAGDAWLSYHTDGTARTESRRANGTLSVMTPAGELISATRPDGTVLKAGYGEGGLNQISQQNPGGETITWKKQADGNWKSDSPNNPDPVKKMSVSLDGEMSFTDANQARTTVRVNGSSHMEKSDGSFVDSDKDGLVRRVGIDKQNYRTLDYKDGELSKVSETTKAGTKVWERKPDGQEERQNIRVSSDGYVSYKVDGKTYVEGSNLSKMELNDNLSVAKVTMPNGSTRDYTYDDKGSLQTITDQRVTAKGTKTETWNRVSEGENGSNRFESRSADGKVKSRDDVYADESGDYLYRTKDGKEHSARARDLLKVGEGSQNIEDARANFEEVAEASGLKMDRLKSYMDALEKRSKDATEAGMKAPTDEQIAKTYEKLAELLKGTGGKDYFNDAQRKALCEQTMYNLSAPVRINQGHNPTCNMTTGEVFIAARYPDKYADTMLQVATTGKLVTSTGKVVTVAKSALNPTQEEGQFDPDADYRSNSRNWASHVMQIYGINAFTKFAPPGGFASWGREYHGGDVNPGMDGTAIRKSVKELTGGDMPYIEHGEAPSEAKLWAYKKDGNFPIGIPTLYARMGGGLSEQHVQTIHDVRDVNGRTQVYLDDQNGLGNDRGWVDLSEVYRRQGLQGPSEQGRGGPNFTRSRR